MAEFSVLNNDNRFVTAGGTILGNATVTLNAGSISTGDFFNLLVNDTYGTIGGSATVFGHLSRNLTTGTQAFIHLLNDSGKINGDALVAFSGGAISIGDVLFFQISNENGAIGGDATLDFLANSLTASSIEAEILNTGGTIGGDTTITFLVTGALTTTGSATFQIGENVFDLDASAPGEQSITVSAGSINVGGSLFVGIAGDEVIGPTSNVLLTTTGNITVGNYLTVYGTVNSGGSISATDGIEVLGGSLIATNNITSSAGTIDLESNSEQIFGNITAGGNITAAGGLFTPGDPSIVSAGGFVSAPGIITGTLTAGTNITIDNSPGNFSFGIIANTISAGGNLNLINAPTISPNNATSDGTIGFTPADFSLTAANIISTGPTFPILSSNGFDSNPNVGNGNPGNGGRITLNITNAGLNVGQTDDLVQIIANGGAFATGAILGGNGGIIDITATEDVNVNGNITADTGANPTGTPAGNGGTVNITTAGTVTVNSVIQTSGNGSGNTNSAKGGNISLTSNKPSGVAINVSNSGQLLALLDQAAPGPGGKITILATGGGGSSVTVNGGVQADKGTVDIRHTGASGIVNLGNGSSSVTLHGDLVKAGALGANGVLNVGQGSLSADSVLKLYAPASNGTLNFVGNVNLSSGTDAILAANTVTIQPAVTVTVQGNGGAAQVFTDNPNYSGFGGNNPNNGTFGGNGANNPLPLNQAPPFDGPPGG